MTSIVEATPETSNLQFKQFRADYDMYQELVASYLAKEEISDLDLVGDQLWSLVRTESEKRSNRRIEDREWMQSLAWFAMPLCDQSKSIGAEAGI